MRFKSDYEMDRTYPSTPGGNLISKQYALAREHRVKWNKVEARFACVDCKGTFFVSNAGREPHTVDTTHNGWGVCENKQGAVFE